MHKCSSLWPPGDILQRSADNRAHQKLHELTLEKQEGDQQRAGAHGRGSRYHRPVKALINGGEDRSSCRQRPCLDTVGCHEQPETVVPVAGNRGEAVGKAGRPRRRSIDAREQAPVPQPSTVAVSPSSLGTCLYAWRSRKMPKAEAIYGRPIARIVSTMPSSRIVRSFSTIRMPGITMS